MAAVLCLIMLPVIAAVGFMTGAVGGDLSLGSAFTLLTFILLAGGLFVGAFNLSRSWDEDGADGH